MQLFDRATVNEELRWVANGLFFLSLSFSSSFCLLCSDILVLNQLSFFLFFAVVFDTLVVRTLVVPSLMFWLGEYNWSLTPPVL